MLVVFLHKFVFLTFMLLHWLYFLIIILYFYISHVLNILYLFYVFYLLSFQTFISITTLSWTLIWNSFGWLQKYFAPNRHILVFRFLSTISYLATSQQIEKNDSNWIAGKKHLLFLHLYCHIHFYKEKVKAPKK